MQRSPSCWAGFSCFLFYQTHFNTQPSLRLRVKHVWPLVVYHVDQLNLRYISTIAVFLKWFLLQEGSDYRPTVGTNGSVECRVTRKKSAYRSWSTVKRSLRCMKVNYGRRWRVYVIVYLLLKWARGSHIRLSCLKGSWLDCVCLMICLMVCLCNCLKIGIDTSSPVATGSLEKELYLFRIHSLLAIVSKRRRSSMKRLNEENVQYDLKRSCK